MIDLIDLTCPTYKDNVGKNRILATDGDNVYLVDKDGVTQTKTKTPYADNGFVVLKDKTGKQAVLSVNDFLVELAGMNAAVDGVPMEGNRYKNLIDRTYCYEQCALRDYLLIDNMLNFDSPVVVAQGITFVFRVANDFLFMENLADYQPIISVGTGADWKNNVIPLEDYSAEDLSLLHFSYSENVHGYMFTLGGSIVDAVLQQSESIIAGYFSLGIIDSDNGIHKLCTDVEYSCES